MNCREDEFSETYLQVIENLFTRGAKTAASIPDRQGFLLQHLVVLDKDALTIAIYTRYRRGVPLTRQTKAPAHQTIVCIGKSHPQSQGFCSGALMVATTGCRHRTESVLEKFLGRTGARDPSAAGLDLWGCDGKRRNRRSIRNQKAISFSGAPVVPFVHFFISFFYPFRCLF